MSLELRPYQTAAIESARAAKRAGHKRILIVSATGSGKTVIAVAIIASALTHGQRVLVIAHRKELVDQFWSQLYRAGIVAGVTRGDDERLDADALVQVGTVQTLSRRELPSADMVFIDEAHRAPSESYARVLEAYPKATVIGLTATPCRLDGKPLKEHFDALVPVASYSELIEAGAIVAPIVYGPASPPNLSRVKKVAGDYNEGQLEEVMMQAHVVGDVARTWYKLARLPDAADLVPRWRSTVVFAVGIEHSRRLVEKFKELGVRAAHLDGETPTDDRERILRDLYEKRIDVVSNVGVLCEGWDSPPVKCCVMARPTLSLTLWMQCAGRILRPHNGEVPLILDHSGNVDRHGLPHEDRTWSLEGEAKRARPADSYRMCAGCYAYVEKMPCPLCGHATVREPRKVKTVEGELERVDRKVKAPTGDAKRDYFDEQAEMARRKGFKPGFAAARWKEKFGDWPPWGWSQALKADFAKDSYWQDRVAKRTREREFWQDRQKAAEQLTEGAQSFTEEPETFSVEDL